MKSKKVHRVILRDLSLRRVRNNLRIIFKLAAKKELSRLVDLEGLYQDKKIKIGLTPSQKKRYKHLRRQWNNLYFPFEKSTLQCGSGAGCYSYQEAKKQGFDPQDRPTNLDLVWVPWLKRWFCIKCFVLNRLGEMTHEDFDDPVTRERIKEEFGI